MSENAINHLQSRIKFLCRMRVLLKRHEKAERLKVGGGWGMGGSVG